MVFPFEWLAHLFLEHLPVFLPLDLHFILQPLNNVIPLIDLLSHALELQPVFLLVSLHILELSLQSLQVHFFLPQLKVLLLLHLLRLVQFFQDVRGEPLQAGVELIEDRPE